MYNTWRNRMRRTIEGKTSRKKVSGKQELDNKTLRSQRSYLEALFEGQIQHHKMPEPVREFTFRCWRFDFAWPTLKIAVEIDGGTYIGGDHVRGQGYERDCKKNNAAQLEGWVVLRADRNMVGTYEFACVIKRMINRRLSCLK
jgi:very-short-patch-repair endonuclease